MLCTQCGTIYPDKQKHNCLGAPPKGKEWATQIVEINAAVVE